MKPPRLLVWMLAVPVTLLTADVALADEPPPGPDLAEVLRQTSFGEALHRVRIVPRGWLEASLTASPATDGDTRRARVFDDDAEGFRFHQAYFAVERAPEAKCCVDFGGKLSLLWGADARLTHAKGLFDDQGTAEEQFDMLDAYLSARFPVAEGLTVKVGKWTTPMGFEVIEAPNNLLFSRSFLFGYAVPFTHAGALATLELASGWDLSYGLVLGWDVWEDNNDVWTHYGGVKWTSPSEEDVLIGNVMIGAEDAEGDFLRTVIDTQWTRSWTDAFKTALNADVGWEEGASPSGGTASWWGIAAYGTGKHSDTLSGTVRVEFFRDADGTRLGEPASLGEVTLGADWTPFCRLPNLHLRPEFRWDHCFTGAFFDDDSSSDQISFTLDMLLTF